MAKTIVYPEFLEKKLKELKIKTTFTRNKKAYEKSLSEKDLIDYKKDFDSQNSFRAVIFMAFAWSDTPEGGKFWSAISSK